MKRTRWVALLLGGILGTGDGLAWAQAITLFPSLAISEGYDDNIRLSSTDRESDFVTSVTPGLRLAITEQPWTVTLAGSLRGEYYASHSDLNTSTDNRQGSLAIEFRPTPRFTASLTDTYVRSLDSGEVDPRTGITAGRFASTGNTVTPAVAYQIDPLTHIRLHYAFITFRSDSPDAENSDTHEAGAFLRREFTPRTSGTFRYTFSRFQPENGPAQDAHFPRVGLAHALSPTIRLSADAGPLLIERSDGSTEITVGGSFEYAQEFSRGSLSVAYERSAGVAGVTGEVSTSQTLRATATLSATRELTVALESGVSATDSTDGTDEFRVYTAGIRFDYRVLRWLSVNAGYRHTSQDDRTGPDDLYRNFVFLGLTASTDFRIY